MTSTTTTTGSGGATTSSATAGPGDASSASATTGAGGAASSSASTGSGGASAAGCTPATGLEYSYACWPMPNPSSSGLPNPSSYTDLKDGTVQDNVTGLVWQQAVAGDAGYRLGDCQDLLLDPDARRPRLAFADANRAPLHRRFHEDEPGHRHQSVPGHARREVPWTSSPWVVSQIATKPQDSSIVNFYEGLTSNAGDRTKPNSLDASRLDSVARCPSSIAK